jgi:hypothetical protein
LENQIGIAKPVILDFEDRKNPIYCPIIITFTEAWILGLFIVAYPITSLSLSFA